jgi:hypothetical protein
MYCTGLAPLSTFWGNLKCILIRYTSKIYLLYFFQESGQISTSGLRNLEVSSLFSTDLRRIHFGCCVYRIPVFLLLFFLSQPFHIFPMEIVQ